MRTNLTLIFCGCLSAAFSRNATAGPGGMDDLIVIDHQPTQVGGPAADTAFQNMAGQTSSQRLADEVMLSTDTLIESVRWWGFYDQDNPPVQETFRMRFYGARFGDGLPDESNVMFEETLDSPQRTATGRTVFVGVDPDEYLYETDLSVPLTLEANTLYWLEITQIGDLSTAFRWEFGADPFINGHAFNNPAFPNWTHTINTTSDMAYQLLAVPEPATASFIFAMIGLFVRERRCRN